MGITVKECFEAMVKSFVPENAKGVTAICQMNISPGAETGTKGGKFYFEVKDQKIALLEGEHPSPRWTNEMDADTLKAICIGKVNPMIAIMTGKMKSNMDRTEATIWGSLFSAPPYGDLKPE